MTEQEKSELQAILDRGCRYPISGLFMPLQEDTTRYFELMEKHAESLYAEYQARQQRNSL